MKRHYWTRIHIKKKFVTFPPSIESIKNIYMTIANSVDVDNLQVVSKHQAIFKKLHHVIYKQNKQQWTEMATLIYTRKIAELLASHIENGQSSMKKSISRCWNENPSNVACQKELYDQLVVAFECWLLDSLRVVITAGWATLHESVLKIRFTHFDLIV